MKKQMSHKKERGASIIIIALGMIVLLVSAAVVVDYGNITIQKGKLQNAMDAAVLAASRDLPDTQAATSTANNYMVKNGYTAEDINIQFAEGNEIIRITGNKAFEYSIGKVLGLSGGMVSGKAASRRRMEHVSSAFDFILFSGSDIKLKNKTDLAGGVYADGDIDLAGSKMTAAGARATGDIDVPEGVTISTDKTPLIMPNFSDLIISGLAPLSPGTYSNQTFNAPLYINGNVTFSSCRFTFTGCVLATGKIIFNGTNTRASNPVCFYSKYVSSGKSNQQKNAAITVNKDAQTFGILYAPQGYIYFGANNHYIDGQVAGKDVHLTGNKLTIVNTINEKDAIPPIVIPTPMPGRPMLVE